MQVKQIAVPADSSIVLRSKERLRLEEEERGRVKEQILKMTQHESPIKEGNEEEEEEDELDRSFE